MYLKHCAVCVYMKSERTAIVSGSNFFFMPWLQCLIYRLVCLFYQNKNEFMKTIMSYVSASVTVRDSTRGSLTTQCWELEWNFLLLSPSLIAVFIYSGLPCVDNDWHMTHSSIVMYCTVTYLLYYVLLLINSSIIFWWS